MFQLQIRYKKLNPYFAPLKYWKSGPIKELEEISPLVESGNGPRLEDRETNLPARDQVRIAKRGVLWPRAGYCTVPAPFDLCLGRLGGKMVSWPAKETAEENQGLCTIRKDG